MDPSKVDWLPAVVVLGSGLAVGAALVWRLVRSAAQAAEAVPPEPVVHEGRTPPPTPALEERAAAPPLVPTRAPALRGFLRGTGAMVGVGALLFSVAQAAKPRAEGESVTGAPPRTGTPRPSAASATAAADPGEAAAKAVLARDPENVDARLELARVYLDKEDFMAVWTETQHVLVRSPGEPRALTYQSQVRLAMGQPEVALRMLEQALKKDPGFLQAYIYVSYVHLRTGQTREAEAAIAEAKRRFPTEAPTLDRGFADMRADAEKAGPMALAGEANPHVGLGAPPEASSGANPHAEADPHPGPNPHKSDRPSVLGTVDLDPALKSQVTPGSVVFVTVREAGFGAGPPIAAKRLPATSFPLSFEISAADSMRGDPIPAQMLLEARLDADGDPLSKDPSDPVARLDDVKAGSADVRLMLKRR